MFSPSTSKKAFRHTWKAREYKKTNRTIILERQNVKVPHSYHIQHVWPKRIILSLSFSLSLIDIPFLILFMQVVLTAPTVFLMSEAVCWLFCRSNANISAYVYASIPETYIFCFEHKLYELSCFLFYAVLVRLSWRPGGVDRCIHFLSILKHLCLRFQNSSCQVSVNALY